MLGSPTPVLRIFDVAKAHEFYIGFLGFEVRWEHRFEDALPLYTEIARDGCVLHLSEHHGDGAPGSVLRVPVRRIAHFHRELLDKHYSFARPGLDETQWGTIEFTVVDPFSNRLRFFERLPDQQPDSRSKEER